MVEINNSYKFIISDKEYIKVVVDEIKDEDCEVCSECEIFYVNENINTYIFMTKTALSDFCYFLGQSELIPRLIDNKKFLDRTIFGDPGIECNKMFNRKKNNYDPFPYHLFGRNETSSWLYNDKDGNIVLSINPFYPYTHEKNKLVSYNDFMKTYKVLVETIIEKENIEKWINQALHLKKTLIHKHGQ